MAKPTLNELLAFLEVAKHKSFRQAAGARGMSPSAFSHMMRSLETNLGVRLFNRTTRSVSLTEAGSAFLDRVAPALQALDSAMDELGEYRGFPSGQVRIHASEPAARLIIKNVLPTMRESYPSVNIDISTDGRLVDIVSEGFDAGVRLGDSIPQDMIAIPIGGPIAFIAVASPEYLNISAPPETPDDLKNHQCIQLRLPSGKPYNRWHFYKHDQELRVETRGALTLDSSRMMALAAAAGHGIAYIPDIIAADLIEDGKLIVLLHDWCPKLDALHVYYPGRRQVPIGLRAFIDVIKSLPRCAT